MRRYVFCRIASCALVPMVCSICCPSCRPVMIQCCCQLVITDCANLRCGAGCCCAGCMCYRCVRRSTSGALIPVVRCIGLNYAVVMVCRVYCAVFCAACCANRFFGACCCTAGVCCFRSCDICAYGTFFPMVISAGLPSGLCLF